MMMMIRYEGVVVRVSSHASQVSVPTDINGAYVQNNKSEGVP